MKTIQLYRPYVLLFLFAWCACTLEKGRSEPPPKEPAQPAASTPLVRLVDAREPAIEVVGLAPAVLQALARLEQTPQEWQRLFAVYVERKGDRTEQPAMLGSYRVTKNALRFEPRFPLAVGVSYRAEFHPANLPGTSDPTAKPLVKVLLLPKAKPVAPTVVAHVYPSKDELPENQLKFYLHFSAPMSRGESYDHIRLLTADGRADEKAFLELPQELWDHDGKRFTLFLDPGRVKRGLKPREDVGPVLEAGKRYTLVIDRAWNDAAGNPLKESYRKTFHVLPPEETQPDPKTWKIAPPTAGTRAAVVMTSPRSLDHALLQRLLWITDERGQKVPGTSDITQQETCWRFTPAKPWQAGHYHLVVDTRLEDLAGNSIARPFELDEQRPIRGEARSEAVRLPFEVRARR